MKKTLKKKITVKTETIENKTAKHLSVRRMERTRNKMLSMTFLHCCSAPTFNSRLVVAIRGSVMEQSVHTFSHTIEKTNIKHMPTTILQ